MMIFSIHEVYILVDFNFNLLHKKVEFFTPKKFGKTI